MDGYSTNTDHYGDVWGELIKHIEPTFTHLRLERSCAYFMENGHISRVEVFTSVADRNRFIRVHKSDLDPFLPDFVILD